MFVGRENDITVLNTFLEDKTHNAICIYGRRGMGKTALMRHFLSDKKSIYFTAYQTTDAEELRYFGLACGMKENPSSLEEILEEVTRQSEALDKQSGEESLILCIDHYGDFIKADPAFDSLLQTYVLGKWNDGSVKLVMLEDMYLNVDKYITGRKATWKLSKTTLHELKSLGYFETKAMLQDEDLTADECAYLYGITGGIPSYIERVKGYKGEAALKRLYFDGAASIIYRPEDNLSAELRELSYYNRMLVALGEGNTRVNQISAIVDKPKDVVVPYFNTLMSIGVVQKENPVTEKTNRKKTRYSIVNTADLFWYRFVGPHMDLFYQDKFEELVQIAADGHDKYMQEVFVRICKEYLEINGDKGNLPFTVDEIGNWWVNDDEKGTSDDFDLVALGKQQGKKATIFGRAFYGDEPVDLRELKELIDLTKMLEHNGDRFYLVFSKAGFSETAKTAAAAIWNIMLITLDEINK